MRESRRGECCKGETERLPSDGFSHVVPWLHATQICPHFHFGCKDKEISEIMSIFALYLTHK